jgi:MFS family permease
MKNFPKTFIFLLMGTTVVFIGDQIFYVVMPLIAVSLFGVSTTKVALLIAVWFTSPAFCGVFAGRIIDRFAKRRVFLLVTTTAALILWLVPLAQPAHLLSLGFLIVVTFLVSGLIAAYDIAMTSAVPQLVETTVLGNANGFLAAGISVAGEVAGFVETPFRFV